MYSPKVKSWPAWIQFSPTKNRSEETSPSQETPSPYPPAPTNSHCHSILLDPNPGVAAEKLRGKVSLKGERLKAPAVWECLFELGKSKASVLHRFWFQNEEKNKQLNRQ